MWHALQSLFSSVSTLVDARKMTAAARLPHRNNSPSPGPISVAGLVMDERDRETLSNLKGHSQWQVRLEDPCEPSWTALSQLGSPIILWDRDLPCGDWRDSVHQLSALPHRPCVLLLSRVIDDYLWNEVVRCGGYDVLSKPLREVEVARAVRLAWSYWASTVATPSGSAKPSPAVQPPTR